jgi:hypothetical protein
MKILITWVIFDSGRYRTLRVGSFEHKSGNGRQSAASGCEFQRN